MKLKPLFDRILARPVEVETVTKSGITLDVESRSSVKKATVVEVGDGIFEDGEFIKMQLKIGDSIFYEDHTTAKIIIDNCDYILIKQTDVLAFEEG